MTTVKHPHDAVIRAYLDGKTVQVWNPYLKPSGWVDTSLSKSQHLPCFEITHKWRVKPESVKVKYRLYLYRDGMKILHVVSVRPKEYSGAQQQMGFLKWLGDEQEIEVED